MRLSLTERLRHASAPAVSKEGENSTPPPSLSALTLSVAPELRPRSAELAGDTLTPERVAQMLRALPDNLPMRARRTALRAAMASNGNGKTAEDVLGETIWRKAEMVEELEELELEWAYLNKSLDQQMEELARRKERALQEKERMTVEGNALLVEYDTVIQFLSADLQAEPAPVAAPAPIVDAPAPVVDAPAMVAPPTVASVATTLPPPPNTPEEDEEVEENTEPEPNSTAPQPTVPPEPIAPEKPESRDNLELPPHLRSDSVRRLLGLTPA